MNRENNNNSPVPEQRNNEGVDDIEVDSDDSAVDRFDEDESDEDDGEWG